MVETTGMLLLVDKVGRDMGSRSDEEAAVFSLISGTAHC